MKLNFLGITLLCLNKEMDSCDLTQPLLENEYYSGASYYDNEASCEESSSGYDSTDVSDTENDIPARSIDFTIPAKTPSTVHVSAKVKSTHALCESLKLILDMPEMCDVTFLVGARYIPVHGVRAILGTRSKVFYQLIIRHLGEARLKPSKPSAQPFGDRLLIPVRKYDAEVFRMLVQFVHCGTATITDTTVAGLLCGADQFELLDLEQACWEYIDRRVELGCGDILLRAAKKYGHHKKSAEILNTIFSTMENLKLATSSHITAKCAR